MGYTARPIVSDWIYLQDLSDDVKDMEGECAREDQCRVKFRQATEGDSLRLEQRQETVLEYSDDGGYREVRDNHTRSEWKQEIYLTLSDADNFFDEHGNPLFRFSGDGYKRSPVGSFQRFSEAYDMLPSKITFAMIKACYRVNPDWDWLGLAVGEDEENPTSEN
jgi:hypothetical protein